ncbi:MAG: toll/interleukin-1 receptor domain-containing protein, partial [Desulfovibrio sp.]|uniref:toll/interleukin-1 receptor domain-containing protein n=1 Tax=Desulfovibrio sp. TaxID=885 RepID=UPI002588A80B
MEPRDQQFDVFISYARADNTDGGINRLVAAIEEEYTRFFPDSRLRVFFDTQTIENGEDWSNRLYTGLKRSRTMIAMLSANYLASAWCRREWQTWCEVERSRGWLSNMLCPVYYVEVPDSERRIDDFVRQRDEFSRNLAACSLEGFAGLEDKMEENECLAELFSRQTVDLKAWYNEGENALRHEEIRRRIEGLARTLDQKVALAKNAEQDEGNFIRANKNFCGRIHELKHIRHCFARPEKGLVPVLH